MGTAPHERSPGTEPLEPIMYQPAKKMPLPAADLVSTARSFTRGLALPNQTTLASMADATGVTAALAIAVKELELHTSLVAEYVRAECGAGRVVATGDADPADLKGSVFLAARSALPALAQAALSLDVMRKCLEGLQTGEGAPS